MGSLLRHLLELLDGDVERLYRLEGLDYRPRFTPVMRTVGELGPVSIRTIADCASLTHSAASQTVAEMVERGLVETRAGSDARERVVHLTGRGRRLLPTLRQLWAATNAAARELGGELGVPLENVLARAIAALRERPFLDRIAAQKLAASAVAAGDALPACTKPAPPAVASASRVAKRHEP